MKHSSADQDTPAPTRDSAPAAAASSGPDSTQPEAAPSSASRPRRGRRRRLAYVVGFLVMIPLGFAVNAGPYQEYQQLRESLRAEEEQVALLESENATYVGEIGRLQKDSYVEALARQELTYARPDEDVFIVKNLPKEPVETTEESGEKARGPLQSMVRSLGGLF